jgi:predicted alpha/beta-hydrolase family hydrolase
MRFNDDDFDGLEMMELFVASGTAHISNALVNRYEFTYRTIRKKWKKRVTEKNRALHLLLDIYAKTLIEVIFDDKTGKLFYPKNIINTRIQR